RRGAVVDWRSPATADLVAVPTVEVAAWSPDDRTLVTVGDEFDLKRWNVRRGAPPFATRMEFREDQPVHGFGARVKHVCFSRDGTRLACAGGDDGGPGEVKVWNLATVGETYKLADRPVQAHDVAFDCNGRWAAIANADASISVWDADARRERLVIRGHEKRINQVVFSPDGALLASASQDATARIWSPSGGQERLRLGGHTGPVSAVCFSPDGRRVASARGDWNRQSRGDLEVKVWDVATGRELAAMQGGADEMSGLAW